MTASPTDDHASVERRIQELTEALSQSRGDLSQARGELAEAREQQAATSEVLGIISRSQADIRHVFSAILDCAVRLCRTDLGGICGVEDGLIVPIALHPNTIEYWKVIHENFPRPVDTSSNLGRALVEGKTIHAVEGQGVTYSGLSGVAKAIGFRCQLSVPLFRNGHAIGVFSLMRRQPEPYSPTQIALVNTFADQAVIAIENVRLFEEVQARTKELQDSLDRQTATSEVLGVISRSPNEVQPALDTIVATAQRLCQAERAIIWRLEGETFRAVAHHGLPEGRVESYLESVYSARFPVSRGNMLGRATLARRAVQVEDMATDPELVAHALSRAPTVLAVPLLLKGEPIGVITLSRTRVALFDDKLVALVESFADQAVIAIENTRLFEAEQAGKRDLQESLEYQTAISEVLGVISRSPTNVQPVFDTIASSALHLCAGTFSSVFRFDGRLIHFAAAHGMTPEGFEALRSTYPLPPGRAGATTRAIETGAIAEIPDINADLDFEHHHVSLEQNSKSLVSVLMLKDGRPIGTITVGQAKTGRFPKRQIALLRTFADQAVIAIENTRLFEAEQASKRELTEALEQQTATADVLKVISRSALDLQRVLDALVESAARLCNAYDAVILQLFGDGLRLVAHYGQIPTSGPVGHLTFPLVRGLIMGRAVIDRRTIHVVDILAEADEYPEGRKNALRLGWRTALAVPLVHAGEAIGVIFIRRTEVRPFTQRQIELVNTFADQAVVEIEYTRLFEEVQARTRELQEAFEYQTATSDALNVISRSPTDVQPVFDMIAESAWRLCEAQYCFVYQFDGELLHFVAHHGLTPQVLQINQRAYPAPPGQTSVAARAVLNRSVVEIPDVAADPEYALGEMAAAGGYKSAIGVPILRDGAPIGSIGLTRAHTSRHAPRPASRALEDLR